MAFLEEMHIGYFVCQCINKDLQYLFMLKLYFENE